MSLFKYRALDSQGQPQNGTLEAKDQDAAVAALHKRGLLLLHIDAVGAQGLRKAFGRGQLTGAALVSFTQQLATLLGAGQPLERSLGILLKQPGPPQTRALIERIREQVKAGQPLSKALEEEGSQFSPLYQSMVRAGEAGGALENTLRQLSDYLERSQLLRGEVINALIYPAFLVVGVLGLAGAVAGVCGAAVRADLQGPGGADPADHRSDPGARPVPRGLWPGGVGRVDRDRLEPRRAAA